MTYGRSEQFKYGPVSYTFETNPAPSSTDVNSFTTCIAEIFGPHGMSNPYVIKYTKTPAAPGTPTDPRWYAMTHCFTAHGLTIKTIAGTDLAFIHDVGVAEDDRLTHVPGEVYVGPMSYIINTTPPPTAANEQAFVACVHDAFGR